MILGMASPPATSPEQVLYWGCMCVCVLLPGGAGSYALMTDLGKGLTPKGRPRQEVDGGSFLP